VLPSCSVLTFKSLHDWCHNKSISNQQDSLESKVENGSAAKVENEEEKVENEAGQIIKGEAVEENTEPEFEHKVETEAFKGEELPEAGPVAVEQKVENVAEEKSAKVEEAKAEKDAARDQVVEVAPQKEVEIGAGKISESSNGLEIKNGVEARAEEIFGQKTDAAPKSESTNGNVEKSENGVEHLVEKLVKEKFKNRRSMVESTPTPDADAETDADPKPESANGAGPTIQSNGNAENGSETKSKNGSDPKNGFEEKRIKSEERSSRSGSVDGSETGSDPALDPGSKAKAAAIKDSNNKGCTIS